MWTRFLLAFSIGIGMRAQQDPANQLRQLQTRIADSLDRLPRFMCTETIDRSVYKPEFPDRSGACDDGPTQQPPRLAVSDRLRLDVAIASTGEMFSWVAQSRFNNRDLMDLVNDGAVSTGSFENFLSAIFRSAAASFTYNGEFEVGGQTLSEYGFRVPHEKSTYRFEGWHGPVITGYDGTFLVDPRTADLVQLEVRTSRLPSDTGACYGTTTLDYSHMVLKGVSFLLPSVTVMRIVNLDGVVARNRTGFSNCHEFLGESSITLDAPPAALGTKADRGPASPAFTIPKGLRFRVALTEGIDTATAAGGDPIKAKLITPIRTGSRVLAPAGAAVVARIIRIQQFYDNQSVALDIRLETVGVGSASIPLIATPDPGQSFQATKRGALQRSIELGTLRTLLDRSFSFGFRNVGLPYLIGSGLESMWVTATPVAEGSVSTPPK